jgi:hypothetical protein
MTDKQLLISTMQAGRINISSQAPAAMRMKRLPN